ncbi:hypothetical protein [Nocardioides plantarum]|uniref:Uncharacterized protein n=1 Tax=Nocardioides plantarum TaxID=29299 RepID=A0ABV5K859_9ACTN|nr:hypothetical protein [Nocardioides plantarum]
MLAFALFLSALTLAVGWLNVDLWRREALGGQPVFQGVDATPASTARDGLDPLRAVALVGLVGLIGVTFHVWQDKVFNYSDDRVGEIADRTARALENRDPELASIDRSDIEAALPDDADLDKLLIRKAASDYSGDATLWQLSDDDGASPHCLKVEAPSRGDADPEWSAVVLADVC